MENVKNNGSEYPEGRIAQMSIQPLPFLANEAINNLRGNIQLSGYGIKAVAVTSSSIHEGKTSLSFRLAKSFAALGKRTVFVDCDIRNSQLMGRYQVHKNGEGLSEFLCGKAYLQDVIYGTDDQYLDIIFTGGIAPNPSELFSSELFRLMLKNLKEVYDYVVMDTPPVNAVIDGVLIANQCDGTVLVVESGVTERASAIHAKQQLEYAGVKILGVVLNKVGAKGRGYGYGYGYGYGQKYGYGYGYGEKKNGRKKKNWFVNSGKK